jgi:hypothetical protein
MITLSEITEAFKNASDIEKQEFIGLTAPYFLEKILLTSEQKPIKRISELEKVTGLYDFEEWEEHKPTILEKIEVIEEKIQSTGLQLTTGEQDERETFEPTSKVKKGAVELLKFVEKRDVIDGSKTITNSVLKHFRKHVLKEELRPKESAAREWKVEMKKIIKELFPGVKFDKKGNGDNRGTRLVFPRNFNISQTKCKLPVSY